MINSIQIPPPRRAGSTCNSPIIKEPVRVVKNIQPLKMEYWYNPSLLREVSDSLSEGGFDSCRGYAFAMPVETQQCYGLPQPFHGYGRTSVFF